MTRSDPAGAALHITCMGEAACAQLASGQRGQVLAVVSDAIYLLTTSHELLWLACDGVPMHRRCLSVAAPLPRPFEGAPLCVDDRCLRIDPGFALDSAGAESWQPPQVNRDELVELPDVAVRLRALVSSLDLSQARGLGRLIPEIVGWERGIAPAEDDLLLAGARPILLSIADACLKGDRRPVSACADELIGLGAGLTPSGDDVLGGLLFGARALLGAYPGARVPDLGITVAPYRTRTNQISFTLLDDLAKGHAVEPMHAIVNGILTGESLQSIHIAIADLTRVGHSTGWDMLAGLFTALLLTGSDDYRQA